MYENRRRARIVFVGCLRDTKFGWVVLKMSWVGKGRTIVFVGCLRRSNFGWPAVG